MVARGSQRFTSEDWNGFWGSDARYYARRRDGACFVIDAGVTVFDLAGSPPPASHAQRVTSLPHVGRYAMRMLVARPVASSGIAHEEARAPGDGEDAPPRDAAPRVFACGVRRRFFR